MATPELTRAAQTLESACRQLSSGLGAARSALEAVAEHDVLADLPANDDDAVSNAGGAPSKRRFLNNLKALASIAYHLNGMHADGDASKTVLGETPLDADEITRLLWIANK